MKKLIALILVVICIVVAVIIFLSQKPPEPPIPNTPPSVTNTHVMAKDIEIREEPQLNRSTRMVIDTKKPRILNLGNFENQELINQKISDAVKPYISEINMMTEGLTTREENDNIMDTKQYEYIVTYDRYNNDIYLSLVLNQNINISLADIYEGGLRSNKWKDTYNVNCDTSTQVYLKDICGFANYKAEILDEVNKLAKQRNIKLVGGSELTELSDTQRFYIKDGKLIVYFEPASIAPYLNGELEFEMPFTFDETTHKFVK